MNQEQWLPVPGYEGSYEVSSLGRVRGLDREIQRGQHRCWWKGRMLSGVPDKDGYLRVRLRLRGDGEMAHIHQLVLAAFVGPCPVGKEVAHRNGTRTDNFLSNLCYKTDKENQADRRLHGTAMSGEANPCAKLVLGDIDRIRDLRMCGVVLREIAQRFGISQGHACAIARGSKGFGS